MFGGLYFGQGYLGATDLSIPTHTFTTSSVNGVVAGPPGIV